MYWYFAEDESYYTQLSFDNKKLIMLPAKNDLRDFLKNKDMSKENFAVMSNKYPPKKLQSFFIVIELPNLYGIRTSQEYHAGVKENDALKNRLGLSVIESPLTLKNIGGVQALKTWTARFLKAEQNGYKAKGIFLVGIPGTGKSFFPKCFAGETQRLLIQLDLTSIMENSEPIHMLNKIFEYLNNRYKINPHEKYVILIDEIEKMIGNAQPLEKRILGRMLTVLNDINTPACEYAFNAIFFATANNLNSILDNNPELLRRGRWDELFFINLPTIEYAKEIFNIYIKKFNITEIETELENIIAYIETEYRNSNSQRERFPYTASEIETFCKRLYFIKLSKNNEKLSEEDINECIKEIIPIVKSAQDGINTMVAQKELFLEI